MRRGRPPALHPGSGHPRVAAGPYMLRCGPAARRGHNARMKRADIDPQLASHQQELAACRRCPEMPGRPVLGAPVRASILLLGQAPGIHELEHQRPFAWTAGRTLFTWFAGIGVEEAVFRRRVYMAAVCRCFPGRKPGAGDRVPNRAEIAACAPWLERELQLLRPRLILPVGKLAISRFLQVGRLDAVVGRCHTREIAGQPCDLLPLPHPSGASTWHRTEPGRSLLQQALATLAGHPAWQALREP